jgi:hypothetical protein
MGILGACRPADVERGMRRLFAVTGIVVVAILLATGAYLAVLKWGLPWVVDSPDSDRRLNGAIAVAGCAIAIVAGIAALTGLPGRRARQERAACTCKNRVDADPARPGEHRPGPWLPRKIEELRVGRFVNSLDTIRSVFAEGAWQRTLTELYPNHPLVTVGGHSFPIWAEVAAPHVREGLDTAIGLLAPGGPPSIRDYDREKRGFDPRGRAEFLHTYRRRDGRNRFNGITYALDRIHRFGPGDFRVDARYGTYFQSVATSEMLEREFINAMSRDPSRPLTLGDMPRRAWLHEHTGRDVLFDGAHRAAALSVAAAIIVAEADGGYSALLSRRSADVKTHPGFRHVFPSGILQPTDSRFRRERDEYSVRRSFQREYAEELFGYGELTWDRLGLSDSLQGVWPIDELTEAVAAGKVDMRFTGLSVPLLTLRPELYVLIFVREPGWFDDMVHRSRLNCARHAFKLNWEFDDERERITGRSRDSIRLELDADFQPVDRDEPLSPLNTVPHAAAALWLGGQVARDLVRSTPIG